MKTDISQSESRRSYYVTIAVVALVLLVSLSVSRAPRFSPDSMHYLDISTTLVQEHHFATYHLNLNSTEIPDRALLWPPVYPALLAVPQVFGLEGIIAVRLVSVLSVLIIVFAGRAIFSVLFPSGPANLCAIILLLGLQGMQIFTCAWSEPPFTAFVMLFLLCSARHLCNGRLIWLALAAVAAALAFLTRYVGLVLLPVGLVVVLQRQYMESRLKHTASLTRLLFFGAVFAASICPWLLRNVLIVGRPLGPARPRYATGLMDNVSLLIGTLRTDIPLTLAVLTIGALAVVAVWRTLRSRFMRSVTLHVFFTLIVFAAAFICLQLILSTRLMFDGIDSRLLGPLYPPLMLLAVCTVYLLMSSEGVFTTSMQRRCGAVLVLAILYSSFPFSPSGWRALIFGSDPAEVSRVDEWIMANTDENTLIVGNGSWERRFGTQRIVLEGGYPEYPALTEVAILGFKHRFAHRVSTAYLVCRAGEEIDRMMDKHPIVFSDGTDLLIRRLELTEDLESSNKAENGSIP